MWLQESLDGMEGDWDITRYSQVNHGFTAWTSGRYHKRAEGRSWEAMKVCPRLPVLDVLFTIGISIACLLPSRGWTRRHLMFILFETSYSISKS